jgi:hypothetical protein
MTVLSWLFVLSLGGLAISALVLKRALERTVSLAESSRRAWVGERDEDHLEPDIGDRIFRPGDVQFVAGKTSQQFARRFRAERTIQALEWLRRVRSRVESLVREHRRTVRVRPDVKTANELMLAFEFLVFEIASGILYCLIVLRGPSGAATALDWCVVSAQRLRRMVQPVAVGASSQLSGVVKTNS